METFRSYSPTPADSYIKPSNSGKKPNEKKRKRAEDAVIVVERVIPDKNATISPLVVHKNIMEAW